MGNQFTTPWTENEIEIVKQNYEKLGANGIKNLINRTLGAIRRKAEILGLRNRPEFFKYSDEEIKYIKDNYKIMPLKYLAQSIGTTAPSVRYILSTLGLKRGHVGTPPTWSKPQLEILKRYYEEKPAREIALMVNKSVHTTEKMLHKLGLFKKKDGKILSERYLKHLNEQVIKARVVCQTKNGPTSIEQEIITFLTKENIPFFFQKLIKDKFLVDFYLEQYDLIIEADGDYWHSLPQNIIMDKSKNGYLLKCGYNLLRIPEYKINNGSFKKIIYDQIDAIAELIRKTSITDENLCNIL